MKNLIATALFAAAAVIAVPAASAQVKAAVPFNFSIGSRNLPAGTYVVNSETASHFTEGQLLGDWGASFSFRLYTRAILRTVAASWRFFFFT